MKQNLRRLLFLFFLFAGLLPSSLWAQSVIQGKVLDARSRQPLEGVTVTAAATNLQIISDQNGEFSIPADGPSATINFQLIGYSARTLEVRLPLQETLQIALQPTATNLSEVIVTGYENNRRLLETAGAISVVDSEVIQRFDESSLVRAVNTVPGVRMEERAPASYRISIRGSSLRSPYGVRNVKMYMGDVPLTEASGVTMLNMLDAGNIGRMEILKGPVGSIYGAGTGGAILLEPKRAAPGEHQLEVGATTGSYGFRRYAVTASTGGEKANALVQFTKQQYDGYREHTAMERDVFLLSTNFYPTENQTISAFLIYSDLFYQLPGALTQEQYNENPRQARGGTLGSVAQNATMNMDGVNVGLSHEYKFSNNWRNITSVYGLIRAQDHPFNTDYERNANQEYGLRSRLTHTAAIGATEAVFTVGGEYQRGFQVARTYDNNGGNVGLMRSDDELIAETGLLFAQAEFKLPADWIATAALSYNDTRYYITRLQQAAAGEEFKFNRDFAAVLSPRVALLKRLSATISAHASVSAGYSPPTEEEILTSDGVLNQELEAEKGLNYEAGVRGTMLNGRLNFDVVGFSFRLNETIVSRQELSSIAVFRNVGSTRQNGIETALAFTILEEPLAPVNLLKLWGSYTYNHFRFREYQQGETILSGNQLTGVAPHMATAGLDLATRIGFYLNLTSNYVDEIPLNDENTVFSDSFLIMGARAGVRRTLGKQLAIDAFFGAENLTNQKYSLGNDLNAFGARFYQPAADRNYYGGLSLRYAL
ncbi:TonB-dependent receptor [Pontibacter qinzhouensis]|uniref:TonB-dependent receptor n=1 Tax=Pontibacter qinzhouensis TaxID=2603253 RepID=A0A5C8JM72_9BACT|nr:TonB-dependent receptor [Pontibacter qinzhouensis]TXK37797.1 TonB-dependent receptor [Pontibacter qinzhouensis]